MSTILCFVLAIVDFVSLLFRSYALSLGFSCCVFVCVLANSCRNCAIGPRMSFAARFAFDDVIWFSWIIIQWSIRVKLKIVACHTAWPERSRSQWRLERFACRIAPRRRRLSRRLPTLAIEFFDLFSLVSPKQIVEHYASDSHHKIALFATIARHGGSYLPVGLFKFLKTCTFVSATRMFLIPFEIHSEIKKPKACHRQGNPKTWPNLRACYWPVETVSAPPNNVTVGRVSKPKVWRM